MLEFSVKQARCSVDSLIALSLVFMSLVYVFFSFDLHRYINDDLLLGGVALILSFLLAYFYSSLCRKYTKSTFAYWLKYNTVLHLSLNHDENLLAINHGSDETRYYCVSKRSRVNAVAMWLVLDPLNNKEGETEPDTRVLKDDAESLCLLITPWQMESRYVGAIHRHVHWYIE